MKNWVEILDGFLVLNDKEILSDAGGVSHQEMEKKVRQELERFNQKMLSQ
jgi:hypothetical protein